MIGNVYICAAEWRTTYSDGGCHSVRGYISFSAVRVDAVEGDIFLDQNGNIRPVAQLKTWGHIEHEPVKDFYQRTAHCVVYWAASENTLGLSKFLTLFGGDFSYASWSIAARQAVDFGVKASPLELRALEKGEAEQRKQREDERRRREYFKYGLREQREDERMRHDDFIYELRERFGRSYD